MTSGHVIPLSTSRSPRFFIETAHALKATHVEQCAASEKLLSAHGMPAARDGKGRALVASASHGAADVLNSSRLGRGIRLSEPSVKRILSRATLNLHRLEQICGALDVSIHEVTRLAAEQSTESAELLTLEQETALAGDANLFACFYLLANGRT